MNNYIMEHQDEADRLEKQAQQKGYSLQQELGHPSLRKGDKVLDAGCGTGLLSRFLMDQYDDIEVHACDYSELRVQQAKNKSSSGIYSKIHYFQENLEHIQNTQEKYDYIISRYVFEHLAHPQQVANELFQITRPGGKIHLIDFDGIFLNYYSSNEELNQYLEILNQNLTIDLYIGRKLPTLLRRAGFENISWQPDLLYFKDHELEEEIENCVERCRFAMPTFITILGSEQKARKFVDLYISEMAKPESCFFYNRIIAKGERSLQS